MKQLTKRGISLLLALCLMFGAAGTGALAVETEPEDTDTTQQTQATEPTEPEETETTEPEETETTEPEETETTEPEETEETEPEETEPEVTEPEPLPPYTTDDGHYMAQPDRLAQFVFPDDWSRPALEFCVANGILNGRENGLAAQEYTTRAEVAALLMRIIGAKSAIASLNGYRDVDAGAWYCQEMSAAVGIGLMKGTSDTTLEPDSRITREQVCVLLSRAFGVYGEDPDSCDVFADAGKISDYARGAVSGLLDGGYLSGYNDGTVRPQNYITRAELAKLLYELVTHICDSVDQLPASGNVVYRGSQALPDGYQLYGNLVLGFGSGTQCVTGLGVSGTLTIQSAPGVRIGLKDYWSGSLCAAGSGCVYSEDWRSTVYASGNAAVELSANTALIYGNNVLTGEYGDVSVYAESTVNGDCGNLYVYAPFTLYGGCDEAELHADLTIHGDSNVLRCEDDGICVKVQGVAENCVLDADGITLQGDGWCRVADLYGAGCSIFLACGTVVDHPYLEEYNKAQSVVKTVNNWYQFTKAEPYSQATMEGFVDKQGYSSDTGYLIWVSTQTLTVNIFTGSQGNWTLHKSFPCALGASYSPTIKGVFKTFLKDNEWDFGAYKCRWVTYFEGAYAFHSRKWAPDYSYLVDPSMSVLVSAGCVRMMDEDCLYIYSNIPLGTTVVVY